MEVCSIEDKDGVVVIKPNTALFFIATNDLERRESVFPSSIDGISDQEYIMKILATVAKR
jgi:hypothetical protein